MVLHQTDCPLCGSAGLGADLRKLGKHGSSSVLKVCRSTQWWSVHTMVVGNRYHRDGPYSIEQIAKEASCVSANEGEDDEGFPES